MSTTANSTSLSPVIPVRVLQEQRDALDRAAQTLGVSRSEVMRHGIALMIEQAEKKEATEGIPA